MTADQPRYMEPTWEVPEPYGYAQAVDSAGTFAAPLLAGFSITLIALVAGNTTHSRWPNAALAVLAAAFTSLVGAVQCAYNAKQYVVTPAELHAWWPDAENRMNQLRDEQRRAGHDFETWASRFRLSYHAGVILIAIGVDLMLVPSGHVGGRWFAILIVAFGALAEISWIVKNWAELLDQARLLRRNRQAYRREQTRADA